MARKERRGRKGTGKERKMGREGQHPAPNKNSGYGLAQSPLGQSEKVNFSDKGQF